MGRRPATERRPVPDDRRRDDGVATVLVRAVPRRPGGPDLVEARRPARLRGLASRDRAEAVLPEAPGRRPDDASQRRRARGGASAELRLGPRAMTPRLTWSAL